MREREGGKEPVQMDTDDFFPKHPLTKQTCLIATLAPGSGRVKFTAKASMGTGRENARFQPTSQCSYVYTRDDDEATVDAHFTEWLEKAKKQSVADLEGGDEKAKAKLAAFRREYETMEIAKVYLKDAKGEPYSYDFTIETVGPLKVSYIMRRACDVGEAMMSKYTSIENGVLPDDNKLRVIPSRSRVLGFDFVMKEQDHTFGNMIQTYLEQNHIYEADQKPGGPVKITYAGYEVPHPLRDELVVRIGSSSKEEALLAFAQACTGCMKIFSDIRVAWMRTVPEAGVNVAKEALAAAVKPNAGVTQARATAAAIVAAAAAPAPAKSTKAKSTVAVEESAAVKPKSVRVPKK
jgi:DNA-directed RNA polymerase subunit L